MTKLKKHSMQELQQTSYLFGANADYLEELYEAYLHDPQSIEPVWQAYFSQLQQGAGTDVSHRDIRQKFKVIAKQPQSVVMAPAGDASTALLQNKVNQLIAGYRHYGYCRAQLDPLQLGTPGDHPELHLSYHGLSDADKASIIQTKGVLPKASASVSELHHALEQHYCSTYSLELVHLSACDEREWLTNYFEQVIPAMQYPSELKKEILSSLVATEGLEHYLDNKYRGQKRFSIEGLDALVPMLNYLAAQAAKAGIKEMVMGMAHRGRLNVSVNVTGKSPTELFNEFDGKNTHDTAGDVKYHMGYSSNIQTSGGNIHLALGFNPSHLEFISPVVMGSVLARQAAHGNDRDYAMSVLMHGDSAFSGEGVVMETLNMSQTRAYGVGGSIHIITNNQIGFTTSDSQDTRSTRHSSDVAKMIEAPIVHVNADDIEAAFAVTKLAIDYRMHFHKDIVINLVGYRRSGHQEADEPRATQPLMYQIISKKPTAMRTYADQLIQEGVCTEKEVQEMQKAYRDSLDAGKSVVKAHPIPIDHGRNWAPYLDQTWDIDVDTTLDLKELQKIGRPLTSYPKDFHLLKQIKTMMDMRQKMVAGELPLDWGCAEALAFASLSAAGYPLRLTGQDSCRGTFFHRQFYLHDQRSNATYAPLLHIDKDQASIKVYDSLLAEAGPLAFEYGYSASAPETMVMWEAQFGDFANAAQVIIDQFICAGWQKWHRLSGLVMLLPHGYEGMGAEHSSARLERYLQLCAQKNIQIFVPTTAAQIFHVLRRQMMRPYRKPLIVFTPKSLLRHKLAASPLSALTEEQLQLVIPEVDTAIVPSKVKRVILCTGKVYYELFAYRHQHKRQDVVIIRVEQLYPFPHAALRAAVEHYAQAKDVVWCQEEPKNQGSWYTLEERFRSCLLEGQKLRFVGRCAAAAPAVGYRADHVKQQETLVAQAFE